MTTVHLIDASPYIFRAYFALPSSMVDPGGRQVGAVYGFATFLEKFREEEAPTHVALAFDGSLTTSFRNDLYPDYKAQRDLPDPELMAQLDDCRAIAEALGFATFIDERFEADDIIGTWAARLTTGRLVVVSSDKDLAQLVDARTELYDYGKGVRYDVSLVREKFGVDPGQLVDYLGLAGDAVDNIPGVRGVGPKTAAALLDHFPDLDALYADLDAVAELSIRGAASVAKKLEAERETAFLSRRLATISTEAPLEGDLATLEIRKPHEALVPLAERLGFEGLVRRALG